MLTDPLVFWYETLGDIFKQSITYCILGFFLPFGWNALQRLSGHYFINLYLRERGLLSVRVVSPRQLGSHTIFTLESAGVKAIWSMASTRGTLTKLQQGQRRFNSSIYFSPWVSGCDPVTFPLTRLLLHPLGKHCPTSVHGVRPDLAVCAASPSVCAALLEVYLRLCVPWRIWF